MRAGPRCASTPRWKSRFGGVTGGRGEGGEGKSGAVGWEKNVQNKLDPHVADLAPMYSVRLVPFLPPIPSFPHTKIYNIRVRWDSLSNQAVDLNLTLMRWHILPSLNLEKITDVFVVGRWDIWGVMLLGLLWQTLPMSHSPTPSVNPSSNSRIA